MRLLQTEYLLKGAFLGLVLYAAFLLAALPPDGGAALVRVAGCAAAGLAAALLVAALIQFAQGVRVGGRPVSFVLFLLLESRNLAYAGILGGMAVGVYLLRESLDPVKQEALRNLLGPTLGASALAAWAFGMLRQVERPLVRAGLTLALAAGLAVVGLTFVGQVQMPALGITEPYKLENPPAFAWMALVGIPFFYLLSFAGHEEESEAEIAIMAGLGGTALAILVGENRQLASIPFLVPIAFFFIYTRQVLPGLRVYKHAIRGVGYARGGRHRKALMAFRRALQLDPTNGIARDGFWEVHCALDLDKLVNDPQTLALVDLDLCLDRAGSLLLQKPTPAKLEEANRLLELVQKLNPARQPQVEYWRAVAATHGKDIGAAAHLLERILEPSHYGEGNAQRFAVLLPAWQLALLLHPVLRERVGEPLLSRKGRRMEAIAAVERELQKDPQDPSAIALKKLLYRDLDEAEYDTWAGEGGAAPDFDHQYAQHLGVQLIDDDAHWQRGGEYLRLAARGLPALGPTLFVRIANAQRRMGLMEQARHNYELAKRAGLSVGHKNLGDTERQAYFSTLKLLGEDALQRGDLDGAIEDFRLYSESEQAGVGTLRALADLYERKGDPLAAARTTDQALQYDGKDADLLERKDRYYYSILAEDLEARKEQYAKGFDADYCLARARAILDRHTDLDWLDVTRHLCRLALVVRPESLTAKLLLARTQLRFGERGEAVRLLEEVRGPSQPEKFATGEDSDAWYVANQLLGDLYLEEGKPQEAIACLNAFRKSAKSGARTWFKMAQAYESMGDPARAKKCYGQVVAYDGNPLAGEAHDALARLG
ncbi:MAG: tetratricopeptide repeat protein [Gemmataceae bacterium]|nr:tetratricopeptide repeat protein [Gemmataceae bacterium]